MSHTEEDNEHYGDEEAQRRFEEALRGGLSTPPSPLKDKPKKNPDKPKVGVRQLPKKKAQGLRGAERF